MAARVAPTLLPLKQRTPGERLAYYQGWLAARKMIVAGLQERLRLERFAVQLLAGTVKRAARLARASGRGSK